jgi:CBS domain containing-hemolysin-like protein
MLGLGLLALLGLIAANAFFVLSEFALVTVDRGRLHELAARGDSRAGALMESTGQLTRHLSAAQFGITVSSLLIGFVAEPLVASVIHPAVQNLPLPEEELALGLSVALALILSTFLQLVLGEQVPKGVAIARPLRTGLLVIRPLRAFAWLFGPPVHLLNQLADTLVRRLGIEPRSELTAARTIEELEVVIRESATRGTLSRETARLLSRAIKFGGRTALDAMTPRPRLVTVVGSASAQAMLFAAARSGHTGIPVQGSSPEEVIGVARVEDALALGPDARKQTKVSSIVRATLAVPESKDLLSLITEMRSQHIQLVTVIDEYGGLAGIVTDEDLLEEMVGEIDEGGPGKDIAREPGLLPGWAREDQVLEETGFEMPSGDGAYETLAGFLLSHLGHIPAAGETVSVEGWRFEIAELEEHRIAWVRVRPPSAQATEEDQAR